MYSTKTPLTYSDLLAILQKMSADELKLPVVMFNGWDDCMNLAKVDTMTAEDGNDLTSDSHPWLFGTGHIMLSNQMDIDVDIEDIIASYPEKE